jgi:hypothetical protein
LETHVSDISRVIQLAVAPVFLLTAIATMINAMNTRLGRIVDRRRLVEDRLAGANQPLTAEAQAELRSLAHRSRLAYLGILYAVLAALLVCLVVAGAFIGALIAVDLAKAVAVIFILAMCSMIVALGMFLREVYLGVSSGVHIKR